MHMFSFLVQGPTAPSACFNLAHAKRLQIFMAYKTVGQHFNLE